MHVAAASTATTALAALLKPRKFSTARYRMHRKPARIKANARKIDGIVANL
jgi:hypothetical protein